MFVYLEGAVHPVDENETTPCGIVVPHGTEWVVPEGPIHCGPEATEAPKTTTKPKSKAKAKK